MKEDQICAYLILANIYSDLSCIDDIASRINAAKKITIKIIIDKCQCKQCLDAAFFIHEINFYI